MTCVESFSGLELNLFSLVEDDSVMTRLRERFITMGAMESIPVSVNHQTYAPAKSTRTSKLLHLYGNKYEPLMNEITNSSSVRLTSYMPGENNDKLNVLQVIETTVAHGDPLQLLSLLNYQLCTEEDVEEMTSTLPSGCQLRTYRRGRGWFLRLIQRCADRSEAGRLEAEQSLLQTAFYLEEYQHCY